MLCSATLTRTPPPLRPPFAPPTRRAIQPHQIGVITPYGDQVRDLKRQLRQRGLMGAGRGGKGGGMADAGVEVSSVDGFQGKEKEVIVFSAVRANTNGSVGFLAVSGWWRAVAVLYQTVKFYSKSRFFCNFTVNFVQISQLTLRPTSHAHPPHPRLPSPISHLT